MQALFMCQFGDTSACWILVLRQGNFAANWRIWHRKMSFRKRILARLALKFGLARLVPCGDAQARGLTADYASEKPKSISYRHPRALGLSTAIWLRFSSETCGRKTARARGQVVAIDCENRFIRLSGSLPFAPMRQMRVAFRPIRGAIPRHDACRKSQ